MLMVQRLLRLKLCMYAKTQNHWRALMFVLLSRFAVFAEKKLPTKFVFQNLFGVNKFMNLSWKFTRIHKINTIHEKPEVYY